MMWMRAFYGSCLRRCKIALWNELRERGKTIELSQAKNPLIGKSLDNLSTHLCLNAIEVNKNCKRPLLIYLLRLESEERADRQPLFQVGGEKQIKVFWAEGYLKVQTRFFLDKSLDLPFLGYRERGR
jgi:hypothetical protein